MGKKRKKYRFTVDDPKRLAIQWRTPIHHETYGPIFATKFTIKLDGEIIATPDAEELLAGQKLDLPDDSVLEVRLEHNELKVTRNDVRVDVLTDASNTIRMNYWLHLLFGSLMLLGISYRLTRGIATPNNIMPLYVIGLGGLAYLCVGFFIGQRSMLAMRGSIFLSTAMTIGVLAVELWEREPYWSIFNSLLAVVHLIRTEIAGVRALETLSSF